MNPENQFLHALSKLPEQTALDLVTIVVSKRVSAKDRLIREMNTILFKLCAFLDTNGRLCSQEELKSDLKALHKKHGDTVACPLVIKFLEEEK